MKLKRIYYYKTQYTYKNKWILNRQYLSKSDWRTRGCTSSKRSMSSFLFLLLVLIKVQGGQFNYGNN
jgi:hypothetical protein